MALDSHAPPQNLTIVEPCRSPSTSLQAKDGMRDRALDSISSAFKLSLPSTPGLPSLARLSTQQTEAHGPKPMLSSSRDLHTLSAQGIGSNDFVAERGTVLLQQAEMSWTGMGAVRLGLAPCHGSVSLGGGPAGCGNR